MNFTAAVSTAALIAEPFTIDVGDYDTIPFEFTYRVDGGGGCRDVEYGGANIPFTWAPSLLEGLEGEERTEALHDHARGIFWDEINDQLDEDRVLVEGDYGSEEVIFEQGSDEELERLVRLTLYAFPAIWDDRDEIDVTIIAGTECEETSVDEYCDLMQDDAISQEDKERICALLDLALDLHQPVGCHLEYNDGASGRLSGYYECANTVCYTVPKPSFHELAEAREQFFAALGQPDSAEDISQYLPQEAEVDGECSISQ